MLRAVSSSRQVVCAGAAARCYIRPYVHRLHALQEWLRAVPVALPGKRCRRCCTTVAAAVVDAPSDSQPQAQTPQPSNEDGFAHLGVDKRLQANLRSLQILQPSPIQDAAIPRILAKVDCAVQSYTGSGKTLAYMLPALNRILDDKATRPADKVVKVLVLAPSQELCMQILNVAKAVGGEAAGGRLQQCIGGANMARQVEALKKRRPALVVGTPGRVAQLGKMGKLGLHSVELLVLDEADQLLSDSFLEDMRWVLDHCGRRAAEPRQTVLVSATLTPSIMGRVSSWDGADPEYISAGPTPTQEPSAPAAPAADGSKGAKAGAGGPGGKPSFGWGNQGWDGAETDFYNKTTGAAGGVEGKEVVPTMPPSLRHYFIIAPRVRKVDCVRRCLHALNIQRALVFHNFHERVRDTMFKLEANQLDVGMLHGELSKMKRAQVLRDFKSGELRALVVNDVVARGLDVPACDAVFHFELPSSAAHYAHRAGRTGRMGAEGTVISVTEPSERWVVEKLARKMGVPILEAHVSHGKLVLGSDPAAPQGKKGGKKERTSQGAAQGAEPQAQQADAAGKRSAPAVSGRTASPTRPAPPAAAASTAAAGIGMRSDRMAVPSAAPRSALAGSRGELSRGASEGQWSDASSSSGGSGSSSGGGGGTRPAARAATAREDGTSSSGRGWLQEDADMMFVDDEVADRQSMPGEPSEASASRRLPPQQKQKFDRILQQAGLTLSELEAFNEDEDDEDDEEQPAPAPRAKGGAGGRRPAKARPAARKPAGGFSRKIKEELANELEEMKREKLQARALRAASNKGTQAEL